MAANGVFQPMPPSPSAWLWVRAIAARDFVEGLREAGEATTLAGLHKESPPPMSSSMQVATQLRSSQQTGAEELEIRPGCKVGPPPCG
mmetsp:Transcript_63162/g.147869  ORF Transcript_63162/g.147869 Transcript_63162/m.147869 type:complete len:88 (+) Transcript_63162:182-445(+)